MSIFMLFSICETYYTLSIPVYNSAKYLEDCVTSVVMQSYTNIEIILINDGSTDGSGEICDKFAQKDNRIKVVHNTNHGVSYSRNIGINMAVGSKILFIDSDDSVDVNYVLELIKPLQETDYDLIISNVNDIYDKRIKTRKIPRKLTGMFADDFWLLQKVPLLSSPWCKLYDAEILTKNKIYFDRAICYSEDFLFNLHYYRYVNAYKIVNLPLYNYFHRQSNSLSKNNTTINFWGVVKVLNFFKAFLLEKDIRYKEIALTDACLGVLRRFANPNDDSYEYYTDRINALRNILEGMYAVPYIKNTVKVLLLKYNCIKILYVLQKKQLF